MMMMQSKMKSLLAIDSEFSINNKECFFLVDITFGKYNYDSTFISGGDQKE